MKHYYTLIIGLVGWISAQAQESILTEVAFRADSIYGDSSEVAFFIEDQAMDMSNEMNGEDSAFFEEDIEMALTPDFTLKFAPKAKADKAEKVYKFSGQTVTFGSFPGFYSGFSLNMSNPAPVSLWGEGYVTGVTYSSYEVFYVQERWKESPIWGHIGLSWDMVGLELQPNSYLTTSFLDGQPNGLTIVESPDVTEMEVFWKSSEFIMNYLTLNNAFVFNMSRSGRKGLSLTVGQYLSVRLGQPVMHSRYYITGVGQVRSTVRSSFYANPWQIGTYGRVGYNNFFLDFRRGATPLFNSRAQMPNAFVGAVSVGYSTKW
jgi:hypothetical protein